MNSISDLYGRSIEGYSKKSFIYNDFGIRASIPEAQLEPIKYLSGSSFVIMLFSQKCFVLGIGLF